MMGEKICQELARRKQAGAELDALLRTAVDLLHASNPRFQ